MFSVKSTSVKNRVATLNSTGLALAKGVAHEVNKVKFGEEHGNSIENKKWVKTRSGDVLLNVADSEKSMGIALKIRRGLKKTKVRRCY